jgi:hypothetical protein
MRLKSMLLPSAAVLVPNGITTKAWGRQKAEVKVTRGAQGNGRSSPFLPLVQRLGSKD